MIVVDATGLVLGRLASVTAKSLLAGEEINIVNAEKVLITGGKDYIFGDYGQTRARGHKERGPYFPRTTGDDSQEDCARHASPQDEEGKRRILPAQDHMSAFPENSRECHWSSLMLRR